MFAAKCVDSLVHKKSLVRVNYGQETNILKATQEWRHPSFFDAERIIEVLFAS